MRVFIAVCALLSSALAQYIDPLVGLLTPQASQPNLYTIRGPIYVEPASLQAQLLSQGFQNGYQGYPVGPAVVGPPIVGPPMVGTAIPYPSQMPPMVGQTVISPSPYNPYAPAYPVQMMYDEQQDEVSQPTARRMNKNVQSGIQQFGQGNMNLQGNIQQVNRRSIQSDQMQSDQPQLSDEIYKRNSRSGSLNDMLATNQYQNDAIQLYSRQDPIQHTPVQNDQGSFNRLQALQDQLSRSQVPSNPFVAFRQMQNDHSARQNQLQKDPSLMYRQPNALNDPLLGRQQPLALNDPLLGRQQPLTLNDQRQQAMNDQHLLRNQLQNDPLALIRQQALNDQLRYQNDLELNDQFGPLPRDPRNVIGSGRGNQGWGQSQPNQHQGGRWNGRGRRNQAQGLQMQGQGLQMQGQSMQEQFPPTMADFFSDMQAAKGYQNDGVLFDESSLMNDDINDELNDSLSRKDQLLHDTLNDELADELDFGTVV